MSEPLSLDAISRHDWDRLWRVTSAATPFSSWTFHRAWWDAYGAGAQPHYLLVGHDPIIGIVPLMARDSASSPRCLCFAASYHSDYATALAADDDLVAVAEAILARLSTTADRLPLDLRRIRAGDAFAGHLEAIAGPLGDAPGWTVQRDQEDVCPSLSLASDWDTQLARLGKKTRHEVRRKLRRAQAQGPLRLRYLALDAPAADRFIELHRARWGADGLFADSELGLCDRRFLHRLVELEAAEPAPSFHLADVVVGDRTVYMLAGFAAAGTCYFYNAGMDPAAADLSPGVVGTALYLRDRLERGETRFDFLRGDEPYKYDWGARDVPLDRLSIVPRGTG